MEKTPELKEVKHIEWTTPLPVDAPVKSSKFLLLDYECILKLSLASTRSTFGEYKHCVMHVYSDRKFAFPIDVTVYILQNNNIPAELSRTSLTETEIWKCSLSRIQKYATNSLVQFGVTFHFQYEGEF